MRNHYILRIEFVDECSPMVLDFSSATRTQMDKAFFALSFASPSSNIICCEMFLIHESVKGVDLKHQYELVNRFEVRHNV